ncbi:MAG: hypothetical protein H0X51_09595 [Parachlamydiaceae bacterium]|nr:hypothetical protein [Parachlamydiaceae bacterium]
MTAEFDPHKAPWTDHTQPKVHKKDPPGAVSKRPEAPETPPGGPSFLNEKTISQEPTEVAKRIEKTHAKTFKHAEAETKESESKENTEVDKGEYEKALQHYKQSGKEYCKSFKRTREAVLSTKLIQEWQGTWDEVIKLGTTLFGKNSDDRFYVFGQEIMRCAIVDLLDVRYYPADGKTLNAKEIAQRIAKIKEECLEDYHYNKKAQKIFAESSSKKAPLALKALTELLTNQIGPALTSCVLLGFSKFSASVTDFSETFDKATRTTLITISLKKAVHHTMKDAIPLGFTAMDLNIHLGPQIVLRLFPETETATKMTLGKGAKVDCRVASMDLEGTSLTYEKESIGTGSYQISGFLGKLFGSNAKFVTSRNHFLHTIKYLLT